MKICVNVRTLEMQLRKAINDKSELVIVEYGKQYMSFDNPNALIPMETAKRSKDDYYGKFHPDQWNNILKFLMQLEDQRPEILMSQISKYFN